MSIAEAPKMTPKGARVERGPSYFAYVTRMLSTTVGQKFLVAITGSLLTAFVIGHFIGNAGLLAGQETINAYAKMLKDTGPLLWIARGGLLAAIVLHLVFAVRLRMRSDAARPVAYQYPATVQATGSSRTMLWTGLVIGAFLIFHLAHYTLGMLQTVKVNGVEVSLLDLKDSKGRHDVYTMTVKGFSNYFLASLYLLAQIALFFHLKHGVHSVFQTLGVSGNSFKSTTVYVGWAVALFVTLGNCFLVLAVWTGIVPDLHPEYL